MAGESQPAAQPELAVLDPMYTTPHPDFAAYMAEVHAEVAGDGSEGGDDEGDAGEPGNDATGGPSDEGRADDARTEDQDAGATAAERSESVDDPAGTPGEADDTPAELRELLDGLSRTQRGKVRAAWDALSDGFREQIATVRRQADERVSAAQETVAQQRARVQKALEDQGEYTGYEPDEHGRTYDKVQAAKRKAAKGDYGQLDEMGLSNLEEAELYLERIEGRRERVANLSEGHYATAWLALTDDLRTNLERVGADVSVLKDRKNGLDGVFKAHAEAVARPLRQRIAALEAASEEIADRATAAGARAPLLGGRPDGRAAERVTLDQAQSMGTADFKKNRDALYRAAGL
jgi:hypothetical protein